MSVLFLKVNRSKAGLPWLFIVQQQVRDGFDLLRRNTCHSVTKERSTSTNDLQLQLSSLTSEIKTLKIGLSHYCFTFVGKTFQQNKRFMEMEGHGACRLMSQTAKGRASVAENLV